MTNPILDELYAVRKQILADHGDDVSGHPIADVKQRSVRRANAPIATERPGDQPTPSLND